MKTLMTAIILVIIFSCKKETKVPATENVTVTNNFCPELSDRNYQICFDSLLEESRCPINANCIWQGVAKVKFRFKVNSQEHILRLSTLDLSPHYTQDTTVAGFHIKLVNVLPYPVYPVNPQQYSATVSITQ